MASSTVRVAGHRSLHSLKWAFLIVCLTVAVCSTVLITLNGSYTTAAGKLRNLVVRWTFPIVLGEYPKLICHNFTGRLGNEMFQYASILGLALKTNRTPVLIGSEHLDTVLETPTRHSWKQRWLETRCAKPETRKYLEETCCTYSEELLKADPRKDCVVQLYLQSWKYFMDFDSEIRRALTFRSSIREEAADVVSELKRTLGGTTLVGIHVRKGDLSNKFNVKLGYPNITKDFLTKVTKYFGTLYPDCVFVVATDSMSWCQGNFPQGYPVVFLEGHSPAVDLTILASLDHLALSFGSFSWWAGYLNHGKVVYVKDVFKGTPNTSLWKKFGYNGEDYVYPGWIGVY